MLTLAGESRTRRSSCRRSTGPHATGGPDIDYSPGDDRRRTAPAGTRTTPAGRHPLDSLEIDLHAYPSLPASPPRRRQRAGPLPGLTGRPRDRRNPGRSGEGRRPRHDALPGLRISDRAERRHRRPGHRVAGDVEGGGLGDRDDEGDGPRERPRRAVPDVAGVDPGERDHDDARAAGAHPARRCDGLDRLDADRRRRRGRGAGQPLRSRPRAGLDRGVEGQGPADGGRGTPPDGEDGFLGFGRVLKAAERPGPPR